MSLTKHQFPFLIEVPKDYTMIRSLEITNFRGFRSISLTNLPRINVLIGESGSGKTSFLEALWIQAGISPEIYFRMRAFRGMAEQQAMFSDKIVYEGFFKDIFFDSSNEAQIQIMDSESGLRNLTIGYSNSAQISMNLEKPQAISSSIRPIVFRWRVGDADFPCPLKLVNNQIVVDNPPDPYPEVFFASSLPTSARETAERLSLLSVQGEKSKVVETIKKIYPTIVDLNSESIAGQQMVWVSVKGLKRAIPLSTVSSGINRFSAFLLWMSLNPGGVILIDEIENGFYFRDYQDVFRTLVEFCDAYNIQLFASTHSWEFLKAVASAMKDRETDLSMLRPKFKNGECSIQQIEGISSIEAINQDLEIRL